MQARAAEILELEDVEILVRLGTGAQKATYWTCDYSHEYMWVDFQPAAISSHRQLTLSCSTINGDYRT